MAADGVRFTQFLFSEPGLFAIAGGASHRTLSYARGSPASAFPEGPVGLNRRRDDDRPNAQARGISDHVRGQMASRTPATISAHPARVRRIFWNPLQQRHELRGVLHAQYGSGAMEEPAVLESLTPRIRRAVLTSSTAQRLRRSSCTCRTPTRTFRWEHRRDFAGSRPMASTGMWWRSWTGASAKSCVVEEERRLERNTMVLFSSDNGPWYQGSPGKLRGRKNID